MDFLSKKVAYYRYPRFALFLQNKFKRQQGIQLVSYHHSQEEAEEVQRQDCRQTIISLLLDANYDTLDAILTTITDHIFRLDHQDQFWEKAEAQLGLDSTPNTTDPTLIPVLRHQNLVDHFDTYQDDYKIFIPDMEFIFNQLNFTAAQECAYIYQNLIHLLHHIEKENIPNYYITPLPNPTKVN